MRASATRVRLLLEAHEAEIPSGSRVLDIGCGNGLISRAIADRFGVEVHGADIENLLTHDLPFHPIIDGRIAVPDRSFDLALYTDVLHHIEKPRQQSALREALRIAPTVLVFEQHPTITAKVLDVIMAYVVYAGREPLPLSHRTPDDWQRLIADVPAVVARVTHVTSPLLYPLRHFGLQVARLDRLDSPA
jgi:SAM-dependent methyltransferase